MATYVKRGRGIWGEELGVSIAVLESVSWRVDLIRSSDMSGIAELNATSRSLDLLLNQAGSSRFNIPLTDDIATVVEAIRTGVRFVRNGVVVWDGMVWGMVGDTAANSLEVSCVGWSELMNYRELRAKATYTGIDAGAIIKDLCALVNAQTDNLGGTWPMWVKIPSSTYAPSQPRDRTYDVGQKIWPAIQELSDIESGVDVWVEPTTRFLRVVPYRGTTRVETRFGYRTWPNNLGDVREIFDPGKISNRMNARGSAGTGNAEDTAAMAYLGQMFEESQSLSDVKDLTILTAYAGAEVVVRAYPLQLFEIVPLPYTLGSSVPQPFVDYQLGDTVFFSCNFGRIDVSNKAMRLFGISLSIDDIGNETVSSLKVTAS